MKRSLLLIVYSFAVIFLLAQAPEAINYQAVIRGSNGLLVPNHSVNIRISLLEDNIAGAVVYSENHNTATNVLGIVNLAIGNGTAITGTFDSIDWGGSYHYIKVEVDTAGGTSYYHMGTSQLLSVPYALESKHSSSLTLTGEDGTKYEIKVDSSGNLEVVPIVEWGQPCPGIPTVTYEGQTYNTVQIGNQCWFKENLNVGTKINSTTGGFQQTNNGIIEKYCYNNDAANCNVYGGFYEWPEAMQYVTAEGVQGICPAGWHIPTDNEWKILEGTVDSQYPVGDSEWDQEGWRGLDAGGNLKEEGTTHWYSPNTGATNSSGFTGLPSGLRYFGDGYFSGLGDGINFWSSTQGSTASAWGRGLSFTFADVIRGLSSKDYGFSVRCIKDENGMTGQPCPGIPTVNYEGQTYNTVQIGSQCWMKENLNVGNMIISNMGGQLQTYNGIIEKYCYDNIATNCEIYGGLYEWDEAMEYVTTEGAQGICPIGWHIPTDNEWKMLEGTVDSYYPVGDPEWDKSAWRGSDAGGNLKEVGTTRWNSPNMGATNSSGFTSLPGGFRDVTDGNFYSLGSQGRFWCSSQWSTLDRWLRVMGHDRADMFRTGAFMDYGLSVRCLKD